MNEVLQQLVDVLQLEQKDTLLFEGVSEDLGFKNVFGGQVCGQAMMAAYRSVEDRVAHSMHGYFLRPGDHSLPIQYEVQVLRDGGNFSARRVIASQHGKEIFTLNASFQTKEQGMSHQFDMPDATDDDYKVFAQDMIKQAKQIAFAVETENAELARTAAGKLGQSCSNCHDNFR